MEIVIILVDPLSKTKSSKLVQDVEEQYLSVLYKQVSPLQMHQLMFSFYYLLYSIIQTVVVITDIFTITIE